MALAAAIAATNADAAVTPAAAPVAAPAAAPRPGRCDRGRRDRLSAEPDRQSPDRRAAGRANSDPEQWNRKAHDITGQYPGIWGGDFGFSQNDIDNRPTVINEAKAEWAAGSLPAPMMHACWPDVATCDFADGPNPVQGRRDPHPDRHLDLAAARGFRHDQGHQREVCRCGRSGLGERYGDPVVYV